eukprot:CAMPEP_0184295128 /NCGR_PEP_ID=MMETSP1049-20130417/6089_1 /TAXON_ID=77928 /ORGANISM="Proteomonas sulcata, Strain CCMP704" /LENGTH=187 /DNA_ID=CAMNT_0026603573 /DNA_START=290 /DNA_END=853 /DNA_ORIENTATION=+
MVLGVRCFSEVKGRGSAPSIPSQTLDSDRDLSPESNPGTSYRGSPNLILHSCFKFSTALRWFPECIAPKERSWCLPSSTQELETSFLLIAQAVRLVYGEPSVDSSFLGVPYCVTACGRSSTISEKSVPIDRIERKEAADLRAERDGRSRRAAAAASLRAVAPGDRRASSADRLGLRIDDRFDGGRIG